MRDDEPPRMRGDSDRDPRQRARPQDEALLREPQVLGRGADDPPDEEVEKDEERDLEREEDALVGRAAEHYSRSVENVTSVEPTVNVSPSSSFVRLTRRPLTSTPFVESRSTIQ